MLRRLNIPGGSYLGLILLLWQLPNVHAFQTTNAKTLKVVATASMISDMVSQIAGEKIELTCIVPIGGDPHIYEPTPKDVQLVAQADLIVRNGLTFEGWLNELIENSGTSAKTITATDGITPIESQIYKNATDPHAWMDASNALVYIDNIKEALVNMDPQNASFYSYNHETYRDKILKTDTYIKEQIATIPVEKRILITSHDAFQYYGRRYSIRLESILGVSTDADIQTSDIIRLNKIIQENQVPALFIESTINPKVLQQLAKDNDVRIGGKLYADSIGDKDSPAPTYLDMLRHNTDVIVAGLTMDSVISDDMQEGQVGNKSLVYWSLAIALIILFAILIIIFNRS